MTVSVENITIKYQSPDGETEAVKDVSFSVEKGDFVSLVGPSGCGKTTILSAIAGLITPSEGKITINGKSDDHSSVGYMLQRDHLFEWRTILENALLGLEIRKCKTRENVEYVEHLLTTYGLGDFMKKHPSQLSGGMRQRAALIRTMATRPDILLLDEPFSALDYQTRLAVSDDIYTIIKNEGKTAIMVTHDIAEAVSLSDRVIVLTRRPAVVKSVYDITFAAGRGSPLQCREEPEFRGYFNQIWRDIDVHL